MGLVSFPSRYGTGLLLEMPLGTALNKSGHLTIRKLRMHLFRCRDKGSKGQADEEETFEERERTRHAATTGVLESAELARKAQERVRPRDIL